MVGWLLRRMLGLHATLVSRLEAEVAKAETFDEGHVRALAALAAALPHLIGDERPWRSRNRQGARKTDCEAGNQEQ